MTFRGDPHRVLGVPPDASMADVKRAYRLLAKRHHPDAGEGSVARFLEVQAAYEVLTRSDATGASGAPADRPPGRRPAQQDPRTAGARRAAGERPGDPGAPPPPGTEWARRPRKDGGRPAPGAGPPGPAADSGHAPRNPGTSQAGEHGRRRRDARRATLGSTTYDETGEVAEPTWNGAAWYGPASGTYWTVNPKEYADPRKHGPEYLARWSAVRPGGTTAPPIRPFAATAPPRQAPRSRVAPAARPAGARPVWPRPFQRFVVGALGWFPFGLPLAVAVGLPGGLIATLPLQVVGLVGMLRVPRVAWVSACGLAAVIGFTIPGVAALSALGVAVRPGSPAPVSLIVLAALAWCGGAGVASSGRLIARPWRTGA